MKKNSYLWIIRQTGILALSAAFVVSCSTSKPSFDSKDLSYIYNPTKNSVFPRYNVTNQSDNQSVLAIDFFASELFFSEANPQGIPSAMMLLTVKLFCTSQGRVLADTAYYNLTIVKEEGRQEYKYNIPLRVKKDLEYVAEVKILDKLRSIVIQSFVPFNTLSSFNRYNFMAQGYFQKNELFNPVLRVNEYVNLVYLKGPADSLYISFYKPYRENPDPPSMLLPEKTIDYGPDTTVCFPYSDTLPLMFPKEGIYLCRVNKDSNEGFTFFNFGSAYPKMNMPEVMIEPLAYLATPDEMDKMRSAVRPKVALDEFWIKCGGNVEKSRELIRIYYTRVRYSNHYFTSYKEGWRTERGMVYIIYGPPDKVYKTAEGESWGYRKPVLKSSWGTRYRVKEEYLFFTFKKKENIFSDNDYFLSRSESLITFWDQAVANWKKGIVFRLDNPEEI
ncbi:MAG: GWxTD domain-containing protein [Bacteroidales bacterium]|jgi:GWxTD domain-containing protein|nr:GWxTD domain-containing protein [Bacteroidales bacterium]